MEQFLVLFFFGVDQHIAHAHDLIINGSLYIDFRKELIKVDMIMVLIDIDFMILTDLLLTTSIDLPVILFDLFFINEPPTYQTHHLQFDRIILQLNN